MSLAVKSKTKETVKCQVVDGGELKSRRHLNVRGKSATLPSITGCLFYLFIISLIGLSFFFASYYYTLCLVLFLLMSTDKDWEDIKFGVDNGVDFYAVSFVKDAKVVHELQDYLKGKLVLLYFIGHASKFLPSSISHCVSYCLYKFHRLQCRHSCYCKN